MSRLETLERQQDALALLLTGGAFEFPADIATVSYDDYQDIITSIQPATEYSIGYDLGGINWLENCHLDKDEHDNVEVIRRERTWLYGNMRAFQLELTTVPRLILITADDESREPTVLDTTWYCNSSGTVVAYRQLLNGNILEDVRL